MYKIFVYLLLIFAVHLNASEIKWAKDFDSGIDEAMKVSKPVLLISSSHSCKYCVILEDTALKNKKVIAELNRDFVSVIVYSDEEDYIPKELWRPATPTIWFLYPNGKPMFQPIIGTIDSENFLKALDIVREKFNKGKMK